MHSYLTPESITCEIRNAAGAVTIDLTDTSMTTVEIIAADEQPGGFLDDVIRSVSGWGNRPEPVPGLSDDAAGDVLVEFENGKLIVDSEPARRRWQTGFVVRVTAPTGSGIRVRTESAAVVVLGHCGPDRDQVRVGSGQRRIVQRKRHGAHGFRRHRGP